MLADCRGELTRALGLELDVTAKLGNVRCRRFAAVLQDGVFRYIAVEPDGGGLSCSLSNNLLQHLG